MKTIVSSKLVAIAFAALMLAPILPVAVADHTVGTTPDVPILPKASPTDQCLPMGVNADILARLNEVQQGDTSFFEDDKGVPALCVNNQPVQEWQNLIITGNRELERLRNLSRELQRQFDQRIEATLPEGELPMDLIGSRTVLLSDSFDGRRTGGFGDWEVVSKGGEAPLWRIKTEASVNGTDGAWRFGDDDGYARGAHQFLVSPEIDLTALRGDPLLSKDLAAARESARRQLYFACNEMALNQGGRPLLMDTCGAGSSSRTVQVGTASVPFTLHQVVTAYEAAFDAVLGDVPLMKETAELTFSYRSNLDLSEDGVRVWIYSGDRAPDRVVLFDDEFGLHAGSKDCVHMRAQERYPTVLPTGDNPVKPFQSIPEGEESDLQCRPVVNGGVVVRVAGGQDTRAFKDAAMSGSPADRSAITGDHPEPRTVRLNLTAITDERIWVLFELKTRPDDRGTNIFEDKARFPRQSGFGFELLRIHAEGDSYLRNFRLKDVGADLPPSPDNNVFGDPNTTRTMVPPGNDPLVLRVHNAGEYTENGTLTIDFAVANRFGPYVSAATLTRSVTEVRPDEVREIRIAWSEAFPDGLQEDFRYRVNATMRVEEGVRANLSASSQTNDVPNRTPQAADPNATSVRPANAASLALGVGNLTAGLEVRVDTLRILTAARADGSNSTSVVQVCRVVRDATCEDYFAAEKGDTRIILVGVRNDGNAAENARAELTLDLEGVDKSGTIADGAVRELPDLLPGETRPVTWTINPTEPGIWRARIALIHEDGTSEPLVERLVYVQRSTGLICLDDLALNRECGPSFVGGFEETLDGNVTAALATADGGLVAVTELTNDTGLIAARSPSGDWGVVADIANLTLLAPPEGILALAAPREGVGLGVIADMVAAPNGTLYLVGRNGTVLTYADGRLGTVAIHPNATLTNFTAAAWHNDTLYVGGDHGRVFHMVDGVLNETRLQTVNASLGLEDYDGTVTAMIALSGRLHVAGTDGLIAHLSGTTWAPATTSTGTPAAWLAGNRTIHALVHHEDRVWAVGDNVLLVSTAADGLKYRPLALPASPTGLFDARLAFASHLGDLFILTDDGLVARCQPCLDPLDPLAPRWSYPTLPRPLVQDDGDVHLARMSVAATSATATYLLGERGAFLSYDQRGEYANEADWTVVPALAARDGGALQTKFPRTDSSVAFRGDPTMETKLALTQSTPSLYRVRMNYHIDNITPTSHVQMRLLFQDFRNVKVNFNAAGSGAGNLCSEENLTWPNSTACRAEPIMIEVADFTTRTSGDGWVTFERSDIAPPLDSAGLPRNSAVFTALEIYTTAGVYWAIDDVVVEALFTSGPKRGWQPLVAWYGIGHEKNTPVWREVKPFSTANETTSERGASLDPARPVARDALDTAAQWSEVLDPFNLGTVSPWHITYALTDRPTWVANDEVWPHAPGGPLPRLRDNWNARLVTPVIDLSQAYDPVVTFRHTYAFRTQIQESSNPTIQSSVTPGDGGFVEVQYLLRGADCGTTDQSVTCGWSDWYRIQPYRPDPATGYRGYPNITEAGYGNLRPVLPQYPAPDSHIGGTSSTGRPWIGLNHTDKDGPGYSYWGRIAHPADTGVIEEVRYTDTYETAMFVLADQVCTPLRGTDCVPTDLAGRQIRVGFHLETAGNNLRNPDGTYQTETVWNHTLAQGSNTRNSYPGEGWYITDFKVLGARELGIDLRATNATINVGYDVDRLGVGPGTRVPLNVTVENGGLFDALGYTVRADVDLVLDGARQESVRIETLALGQQPVLEAGKRQNHTLVWDVPTVADVNAHLNATRPKTPDACTLAGYPEGKGCWNLAEKNLDFSIRIEVVPVGIDRDEDHTDNVQYLGTFSRPLPARTVREFSVEMLVSPENATIDITRYVPIYLNNTGNVPLDGFTVVRDVTILQGVLTGSIEERKWETTQPVPPGTRVGLASVADGVDPTADLFWKAPQRANYIFSVSAATTQDGVTLTSGVDKRVSAFATYLFDDVDTGPRGESIRGQWDLGAGWSAQSPGFLGSAQSYSFGDSGLTRYPASTDGGATTPLIDLAGARSAKVAFFHRYRFEPGFDAGVLEASIDGGKTWTTVSPVADLLNGLPQGYNHEAPVSPANPIHATGDPRDVTLGYTGDSWALPTNLDGWVVSQFDLTHYAHITEDDVPYELYDTGAIAGYTGLPLAPDTAKGHNVFTDKNWLVGAEEEYRYWQYENLTLGGVEAPTVGPDGDRTFWWSGSATLRDDGVRPLSNNAFTFTVDLSSVQPDETVIADWWEWSDRYVQALESFEGGGNAMPPKENLLSFVTYHTGFSAGHNYRFNLTRPVVLETQGQWVHLRADLTPLLTEPVLRDELDGKLEITFAYTPIDDSPANDDADYTVDFLNDRGWAIDGFSVRAERISRGQVLGTPRILMDEATAWSTAEHFDCGLGANTWKTGVPNGPACFGADGGMDWNPPKPIVANAKGQTWWLVDEIPAVPGGWASVPVRDHENATADSPRADGSKPSAWWTGQILPTTVAACKPTKDNPCPGPGTDTRLATPAIDLGIVAGDSAFLTFWHRYAFHGLKRESYEHPLSSGGVVEISVYDGQTGTWSAWKQLYPNASATNVGPRSHTSAVGDFRGGYSAYSAHVTPTSTGAFRRNELPFDTVYAPDIGQNVTFLYSDTSLRNDTFDGRQDGWVEARFDVSDYIGKRVRFGFHAYFSGADVDAQAAVKLTNPDGDGVDKAGWWVNDIAVVGRVLAAQPLQLRLRAATDGNVQDGIWQVDDFGVFGARYRNNVALFVDSAAAPGVVAGASTVLPVTVRNLGESVRRDLAIEIRQSNDNVKLEFAADAPKGIAEEEGLVRLMGYTLAPGQSVTINLTVTAPLDIGTASETKLLFDLKEYNPVFPSSPYVDIVDNEVQGFLSRTVPFKLALSAIPEFPLLRTLPATPQPGEPIDLVVTARNPGFVSVSMDLSCTAQTAMEYQDVNHHGGARDVPVVAASYPCERTGGDLTLAPGEWTNLTFRATPTVAGFVSFTLTGTSDDGFNEVNLTTKKASAVVGQTPVVYANAFEAPTQVTQNWTADPTTRMTGYGTPSWSYARGHAATGSLLLGINETSATNGAPYDAACGGSRICVAASKPVDLHNFSADGAAYLTFWHQDRFAKYDGGNVLAQVLHDEARPNAPDSWGMPCVLEPVGGYEGRVRQYIVPPNAQNPGKSSDPNGAFNAPWHIRNPDWKNLPTANDIWSPLKPGFFVTDNGAFEETWSLARFDLRQPCDENNDHLNENKTLLGRTVRFIFASYVGADLGEESGLGDGGRGQGHGWLIDDVSIGPLALELSPEEGQRARLLDNTTKSFNVVLSNTGSFADVVKITYDEGNSSAPAGTIRAPADAILLEAGETRVVPIEVTLPRDPSLLPTIYRARLSAQSLLDPNSYGETTLELVFAPRQWAELSLSVQTPTTAVQEGTETFIPITVENNGLVESVASRVHVLDTWAGGSAEYTLDLPPVPSYYQNPDEATSVIEFRWRPAKGSVGPHTLTFTLDPDVLGEEYTRVNNVAVVPVPVAELLIPDVSIEADTALTLRNALGSALTGVKDADVTRYEVTAGELVSFDVRIVNHGRAAATNIDVRAFIGSLNLPARVVPYIAPGGEVVVTFNWLAQKGEHQTEFIVRTEQLEASTANNRNPVRGVTLLTVKGYEIAVEIPALEGVLDPATSVAVPFSVVNTGNAGEELLLRAKAPAGMRLVLPRDGFYLRAGETYDGVATLHLAAEAVAGEQFISIEAVSRENPMKVAAASAPANVKASYGGSVAAGIAEGMPSKLVIPVTLVNEGNSLEPWTVTVRLPAGWVANQTLPAKVVVPAHGTATLELEVRLPETTAPGHRVVSVRATMPNGERRDGLVEVNVLPLRAASVKVASEAPKAELGALSVPVTVENRGNVKAPFEVVLVDVPEGLDVVLEPSTFEIAPGGRATAKLLVRPDAGLSAGDYALTGYALFPGVNPDTTEGRANVQVFSVPVVRQDLRLGSLEYSPRSDLSAGDRVQVKVPLTNRGQSALENIPVHLYVDDVFITEAQVARLLPGERVDVTLNWTAIAGVHTITVVADPYADTVDVDREDNAVSALATVGVDSPAGGLAAGRTKVPAPGLFAVFGVLAAAAILAIPNGGSRRNRR